LAVSKEAFTTDKFKKAMKRCFIEAGQWPKEDGTFVKYVSHDKGTISKIVLGNKVSEGEATLATITTDVDIEPVDEVPAPPPFNPRPSAPLSRLLMDGAPL